METEISRIQKNKKLDSFLALRPVFVTFGSMQHVSDVLLRTLDALSKHQHPALVCANLELIRKLSASGTSSSPNRRFIESIPYDFAFQHCRCIIHHGGAGTTAAAAYAGKPSLIIPVLQWTDQNYWARVISAKGAAVYLPLVNATVENIHKAVSDCLELVENAKNLAGKLNRQQEGASQAARLVHDYIFDK